MEMNHLFKLNSSLPIQTPLPSISYTSLYSSFISSQSCHNLSSCYYPLPLTSRDQIKHQLSKEFHSSIQEIDPIVINEIRINNNKKIRSTKIFNWVIKITKYIIPSVSKMFGNLYYIKEYPLNNLIELGDTIRESELY